LLGEGTGCSWIFVTKAPTPPVAPAPPAGCTISVASPVLDTIFAGLLAAGGIAVIAISESSRPQSCSGSFCLNLNPGGIYNTGATIAGAVMAAGAIPLAFSAAHGYSTTAECRDLRSAQLSCTSGVEDSCRMLRGNEP
jgi:hypothetical protein